MPLATSSSTRVPAAACVVLAVCAAALAQTNSTSPAPTNKPTAKSHASSHASSKKGKKSRKSASWRRGQQKIDPTRAREIQEALIREHYLDGTPSGKWDDASQKAMERYQADNGWQSKSIPDSRALIKLGLGPDHEHLLNPESAMTTPPQAPKPAVKSSASPASAEPPATKPPQ